MLTLCSLVTQEMHVLTDYCKNVKIIVTSQYGVIVIIIPIL